MNKYEVWQMLFGSHRIMSRGGLQAGMTVCRECAQQWGTDNNIGRLIESHLSVHIDHPYWVLYDGGHIGYGSGDLECGHQLD